MDAADHAKSLLAEGSTIEEVLAHLRKAGYHQIESIKALRESAGLSLREADLTVLESETWSDQREETDRLRDALWADLVEHADEVETDPDGRVSARFDLRKRHESEDHP